MSVCFDGSGVPIPCSGWTVYDSYVTDPRYQKYFTIAWTSTVAIAFILTVPSILQYFFRGQFRQSFKTWQGLFGVYDASTSKDYKQLEDGGLYRTSTGFKNRQTRAYKKPLLAISALFQSLTRTTLKLPFLDTYSSLSVGHLCLLLLIPAFLFATLFPESRLAENPNRFGFLALACVPPLFVFGSKNGPVSVLLGRSWTTVNFLHRWLGRAILILVICHFGLWSVQWARAGQLSEFLSSSKERRGIGAFSFLVVITLSSLPRFRRFSYPVFFTLHYVSIVGFLVCLNRHTIYARGWATWSVVGIYAVDIVGRVASMRFRWVEVEALDEGMTRIEMKGLEGGWIGGQTIDLRLFFVPPLEDIEREQQLGGGGGGRGGRIQKWIKRFYRSIKAAVRPFESHPFSIATAPPLRSAQQKGGGGVQDQGIELYARSCGVGTWTDDLYRFASSFNSSSYDPVPVDVESSPAPLPSPVVIAPRSKTVHVLALFFGPYASGLPTYSTPDVLEEKETVSLFAGGSGMSFILGILDELVGRRLKQGKRGQIELVWVVKEESHISWFLPRLDSILSSIPASSPLSVSLDIYVSASPSRSSSLTTNSLPSRSTRPLPPFTTMSHSRPHLGSIVSDQISRILSPCSHCYPVCRCGETNEEGVCANEEEECVGGCAGVGNGTELLFDQRGGGGGAKPEEEEQREKDRGECRDEIDQLPVVVDDDGGEASCCGGPGRLTTQEEKKKNCCSSATGSKGCCSSRYPPDSSKGVVTEASTPLRVRNGGFEIIVCGPPRMTGELRNAVARVSIAKQVRIGGIGLHVEHFGI